MSIVRELKRRNVFRMAVLYLVAAWLIMQVVEVLPILDELMETRERGEFYVPAYFTGVIYTQLGDFDQAFKWLDLAVEERSVQLAKLDYDPYLVLLHDDPRFKALKEKIRPD